VKAISHSNSSSQVSLVRTHRRVYLVCKFVWSHSIHVGHWINWKRIE